MDKIKAFIIKYKWWLAGGAVALAALYLLRGSGGSSSGGGVVQTSYTTSDGGVGNQYTDPTLMLEQLKSQTNLAGQQADLQSQLNLANIQKEISLATLDTNKWLGQLDSNTQTALGSINANMGMHVADQQTLQSQIGANVKHAEIDANKFIASKQSDIAKYQAQTARRGQEYGAIQGLLNWGGGFFK